MSKVRYLKPESDKMKLINQLDEFLHSNKMRIFASRYNGLVFGFYNEELNDYEWFRPTEDVNNHTDFENELPLMVDNLFYKCEDENGDISEFETDE